MTDPDKKVHAVFDGIEEEDNHLPTWWLAILYITIVFGFGYWFAYHTAHAMPSAREEYNTEAAERKKALAAANPVSDEALLALSKDTAAVAEGQKSFGTICVACHLANGAGLVGPNLTDKNWIHSGKPSAIYQAIMVGFPEKGMPPWGATLGPEKTRQVVAFVLSIKNTNVPGGKAPQGDVVEE